MVYLTAVYIPPQANAILALAKLLETTHELQNIHPDDMFIIAGDFNHANLKDMLSKFHQVIDFPTRGNSTLEHMYCNITKSYKASPSPILVGLTMSVCL